MAILNPPTKNHWIGVDVEKKEDLGHAFVGHLRLRLSYYISQREAQVARMKALLGCFPMK